MTQQNYRVILKNRSLDTYDTFFQENHLWRLFWFRSTSGDTPDRPEVPYAISNRAIGGWPVPRIICDPYPARNAGISA